MFAGAFVMSLAVAVGAAVMPAGFQSALSAADRQIRADVQKKLGGLEGKVSVNVQDGVVTLSGILPSLWDKEEPIRRALTACPVQSLAPTSYREAENDAALAPGSGSAFAK